MPLRIEAYDTSLNQWLSSPDLGPSDNPGSMSSNLNDGKRVLYVFYCADDDSHSVINRMPSPEKRTQLLIRRVGLKDLADAPRVATLRRGDEPYRVTVQSDTSEGVRRIIRFTHL